MVRSYRRTPRPGLELSEFEPLSEYAEFNGAEPATSTRRPTMMSSRNLKIASGVFAILLCAAIVLGIWYSRKDGNSNDSTSGNAIGDQLNLKDNARNNTIEWSMINPTTSPTTRPTQNTLSQTFRSSISSQTTLGSTTKPTTNFPAVRNTTVTSLPATTNLPSNATTSSGVRVTNSTLTTLGSTSKPTTTQNTTIPVTNTITISNTTTATSLPATTTIASATNTSSGDIVTDSTLVSTDTSKNADVVTETPTPVASKTATTVSESSTQKQPSTIAPTEPSTTIIELATPNAANETEESIFEPTEISTTPGPTFPEPVSEPKVGQWYIIMSYSDGRVLDVYKGSSITGTQVGLWPFNHGDNQHFRFNQAPSGNTSYTIESRRSGKQVIYRTSRGFHKKHNSPIQLYDSTFSTNEIWSVNQRDNRTGLVQIENLSSKVCLGPNTSKNSESHDTLTAMNCRQDDDNQLWRIIPICE